MTNLSNLACYYLGKIKLVIILVKFYRLAYYNYFPLLIILYLNFAKAKVDAITLLNHFDINIFYNILQQILKNILSESRK